MRRLLTIQFGDGEVITMVVGERVRMLDSGDVGVLRDIVDKGLSGGAIIPIVDGVDGQGMPFTREIHDASILRPE